MKLSSIRLHNFRPYHGDQTLDLTPAENNTLVVIYGENTGQGVNYVSLSITVSGGLALCTLVAAPAVTLAYSLMDDLRGWLVNAASSVGQVSSGPKVPRTSEPEPSQPV